MNPIQLTKRLGIPNDVLPARGLTLKQLEKEERSQRVMTSAVTVRSKDETKEEKRERKQAVKAQRKVVTLPQLIMMTSRNNMSDKWEIS